MRRVVGAAQARGTGVANRGRLWIENQDPASRRGATISWWRRYQAADGQLYAVLLSAYFFLTVLPVTLVEASYVYANPAALADHVAHRLGLTGSTAALFRTVLVGAGEHRFTSVLLAILNLAVFGLGLGRVWQLVHARSWGIDLRKNAVVDQARYASVLAGIVTMTFLFVLQTRSCEATRPGSDICSTSPGSRSSSASSPGRRGSCCTAGRRPRPSPQRSVHGARARRTAHHLHAPPCPLPRDVFEDIRSPGNRDGAVLLAHPLRDHPRPRRCAVARARPSSRPAPIQTHNIRQPWAELTSPRSRNAR